MKKTGKRLIGVIVSYALFAVFGVGLIVGNIYANKYASIISVYLNQKTDKIVNVGDENIDTEYFKSAYGSDADLQVAEKSLCEEILKEGSVLLKNDGALPLASSETKISLFGVSSRDTIYGGSGAGSINTATAPTMAQALTSDGFSVNPTLVDFYLNGPGKDYKNTTKDAYGMGAYAINEVPSSVYTSDVKSSFAAYGDAAIVVLGRAGGESGDLDIGYLSLTAEEKDLLTMVHASFPKVIVILNASNPLSMAEFDQTAYGVDACLWIGSVGQDGLYEVGDLLKGADNPSGRLVDTYAYDWKSAPAAQNFGSYSYSNVASDADQGITMSSATYVNYLEGIYVGYRYYETRYEDAVLKQGNPGSFSYGDTVQYPFGYGLSYTDFSYGDCSLSENGSDFVASVKVTNSGAVAGKDVVEVYMQSPYTDYDRANGVEKASVELVGFAKTSLLAAGGSETVSISIPKEEMAAYDRKTAKTYIVDDGDYYFAVGKNAHDAINYILAKKGKGVSDGMDAAGEPSLVAAYRQTRFDATTYAKSAATGNAITNELADVDMSSFRACVYLTRNDWTGTFPTPYVDDASANTLVATAAMIQALKRQYQDDPNATMPTTSTIDPDYGRLQLVQMMGIAYEDPIWDVLLDQMTPEEMYDLVRVGGYQTHAVESVGKPATVDKDGPAGISATLVGGGSGYGFPSEITLASTWNPDIAERMGKLIGEDGLRAGVQGWYAPAMNTHRTAYSGRNLEYYSEDGFLGGKFGAATVRGAQSKGLYCYIKHFALNDQETNRYGGCMFCNEQAAREIYLKPFEMSVREGGALALMDSMNRIGCTWSGSHEGLMTEILRQEWGFQGMAITDQASYNVFYYMEAKQGFVVGTDMLLNTDSSLWPIEGYADNPTIMTAFRRACKNILFTCSRSAAMNGLSSDTRIVKIMPTWQKWLIAGDVAIPTLLAAWAITETVLLFKAKKKEKQAPSPKQ
jgi:beta-glucosidase